MMKTLLAAGLASVLLIGGVIAASGTKSFSKVTDSAIAFIAGVPAPTAGGCSASGGGCGSCPAGGMQMEACSAACATDGCDAAGCPAGVCTAGSTCSTSVAASVSEKSASCCSEKSACCQSPSAAKLAALTGSTGTAAPVPCECPACVCTNCDKGDCCCEGGKCCDESAKLKEDAKVTSTEVSSAIQE